MGITDPRFLLLPVRPGHPGGSFRNSSRDASGRVPGRGATHGRLLELRGEVFPLGSHDTSSPKMGLVRCPRNRGNFNPSLRSG